MLTPDWSKLTLDTFLAAMGQAFYSLSIGMAILTIIAMGLISGMTLS